VLEAWASGVPVVSTNVGGVPFLVEEGVTGLLVPPSQPEALANAVLRLLDAPGLRASLVDQGLREAQRYTWAQVSPLLLDVYEQALPARIVKAA
jgi:glycosyltransferase involved in cell wall biosynthesis